MQSKNKKLMTIHGYSILNYYSIQKGLSMDHHHDHSHEHEYSQGSFILVVVLNVIITAAEYIGGIISGSLALISDAGHNLSDVISLILGYIGQKVSQHK
ncbi:MAG TPA: cation transporter, partial [Spirochaetota bacterium]|nr:cation transporter [Spirochaetota bacterium]